jgi:hypothetical protein
MTVTSAPPGVTDTSWIIFDNKTNIVSWVKPNGVGVINDYTKDQINFLGDYIITI